MITDEAWLALSKQGADAWRAVHPEPNLLFVGCLQCGAEPGEACRSPRAHKREHGHAPRQDAMIRAHRAWNLMSIEAGDAYASAEEKRLAQNASDADR